jgi:hypothetical protein
MVDEGFPDWAQHVQAGALLIPHYDHVRIYTNERLTAWDDWSGNFIAILLQLTHDPLSHNRRIIYTGKVLLGDKIRYVYMDDMEIME